MVFEYFRPAVNYNSWADRFSSFWTFLLVLGLAVLTAYRHYIGPNAMCFTPQEFTIGQTKLIEQACWLARQNVIHEFQYDTGRDIPNVVLENESLNEDSTRTLYQWLPIILVFQALLFRLPDVILRLCETSFGFGSQKIVGLVTGYSNMTSLDRTALIKEVSKYFNEICSSRPFKFIPLGIITAILAFVKLLFFINAVVQLSVLEGYLSPANVTSYGEYVVGSIISTNYSQIAESPAFPRQILCDYTVHDLGRTRKYMVQCLLPVNEFNEQICFFLWIWLLIVAVTAGTSGAIFLVKSLLPMVRQCYIKKYLRMGDVQFSSQNVSHFSSTVIGQDGVIMLRMIGDLTSDLLVKNIVLHIWKIQSTSSQSQLQEVSTAEQPNSGYQESALDSSATSAPEILEMKKI